MGIQRLEAATVQFLDELPGWNRTVPATLILRGASVEQRRAMLKRMVATAIAMDPALIEVEHAPDRPPIVARPLGAGLYLSSSSRGGLAALAAAPAPVGVDLELVDPEGEIPWNVLHPTEQRMLEGLPDHARPMAFARLWSLKEAYVKSLGVGLEREPSSFGVDLLDGETALIIDPSARAKVADARTAWRSGEGRWIVVSTVVLVRQRH